MDANVVIVNWNGHRDTVACLANLASWQRLELRRWVVDNGSLAGEAEAIASAFPGVNVLRSDRNLGFAGATNLALRRILEESSEPVLLLNNDVTIEETSVEALIATLEQEPRCGVAAPVLYGSEGREAVLSAGSRSPLLYREPAIRSAPSEAAATPVAYVSGAAVLIREQALREVGLLEEAFFFALEMADFCRRVRARRWRCLVDPRATAVHHVERASGLRETLYVYYAVRNRLLYARRAVPLFWPAVVAAWALYGVQAGLRLGRKGRRATARAILLGTRDGVVGRFGGRNEAVLAACGATSQDPGR